MKKEYYIQGDPARAGQIKAAFESKGCEKSNTRDYSNEHWFFFTYKGKVICTDDEVYIDLVKGNPGYTELPLSVEPKFKTGDWVVKKDGKTFYGGNYAEQITLIEVDEKGKRIWLSSTTWTWNDDIRLWTIADAKDGDVLATDNGWTCIFQAFDGRTFSSYCFMDSQNWFYELGSEVHTQDSKINGNIHPATKEQRDLFFKKMKEAGYTWDKKKKELKKTPVKPQFKAGDWLWHKERGVFPVLIAGYDEERGYLAKYIGSESYFGRDATENEYRLWTINDAKDGDVLVCYSEAKGSPIEQAGIFKQYVGQHGGCSNTFLAHTGIDWDGNVIINGYMGSTNILPATKEQRDLLFAKMKESGYEWDADKKELNKIQTHYGIANFHEGMPVLVRDDNSDEWNYLLFSHYRKKFSDHFFAGGSPWCQCIPFGEETKHLLGTTDPCDERYVNW